MKIRRARRPKNTAAGERPYLPAISDNITYDNQTPKNDSHKVSLGPDSKR
jgi:hypothetical protein